MPQVPSSTSSNPASLYALNSFAAKYQLSKFENNAATLQQQFSPSGTDSGSTLVGIIHDSNGDLSGGLSAAENADKAVQTQFQSGAISPSEAHDEFFADAKLAAQVQGSAENLMGGISNLYNKLSSELPSATGTNAQKITMDLTNLQQEYSAAEKTQKQATDDETMFNDESLAALQPQT